MLLIGILYFIRLESQKWKRQNKCPGGGQGLVQELQKARTDLKQTSLRSWLNLTWWSLENWTANEPSKWLIWACWSNKNNKMSSIKDWPQHPHKSQVQQRICEIPALWSGQVDPRRWLASWSSQTASSRFQGKPCLKIKWRIEDDS